MKKRLPRYYASKAELKIILKQLTGHEFEFFEASEADGKRSVICFPSDPSSCRSFLDWQYDNDARRKFPTFSDAALATMTAWTQHDVHAFQDRAGSRAR